MLNSQYNMIVLVREGCWRVKLKCDLFVYTPALELTLFACTPDIRHVPLVLYRLDLKVDTRGKVLNMR